MRAHVSQTQLHTKGSAQSKCSVAVEKEQEEEGAAAETDLAYSLLRGIAGHEMATKLPELTHHFQAHTPPSLRRH